jgi:CMP-N-acetylneuraminic acid synthetase
MFVRLNPEKVVSTPKNLAVITARGGSKRLPGKNARMLGEHPLIAHSILYAQRFPEIIDSIVVTTDNEELVSIAKKYGAEVLMRPAAFAGDHEPVITALQHVLENASENYENLILLQPTNPLRPKNLLAEAFAVFSESTADSLMTVSRFEAKYGKIHENLFVPSNYTMGQRSQDLKPMYKENGLLYITKCEQIKEGIILAENNYAFVTETPFDNADIDTEIDFLITEILLKKYKNAL